MNDLLSRHSDMGIMINDETEARLLLTQLGMIAALADSFFKPGETLLSVLSCTHPTHHVMGSRFRGFSRPEDNGYQVLAVPKTYMDEAGFLQYCSRVFSSLGIAKIDCRSHDHTPTSN